MKKGQVYEGIIEKVAFPNKCHIQVDGKTVVVKKWKGRRTDSGGPGKIFSGVRAGMSSFCRLWRMYLSEFAL